MHQHIRDTSISSGRQFVAATLCVFVVVMVGCGPGDPRITIQGTVMFDGRPLSEGQVIFKPANESLRSEGAAVKNGGFTIRVHKGRHRVEINAQVSEPIAAAANVPEGMPIPVMYRSIIPPRYNEKSTLSFDVQSAKDQAVFDLKSKK